MAGSRARAGASDQFQTTQTVSATGQVGIDQYIIRSEGKVRIDTFGADPATNILIEVKILGSAWQTLGNHTGAKSESYVVLDWDFIRFTCDAFSGSSFTMYATGFFLIEAEVNTSLLNQEATQLQVLDKLCDLLGQSSDGWHERGSSTPAASGAEETIYTSTAVPGGESRYLNKVEVTCIRAGKFRILVGATEIGSGHLTAQTSSYQFLWIPAYTMTAGQTLEVKWTQTRGTTRPVDVYAHGTQE